MIPTPTRLLATSLCAALVLAPALAGAAPPAEGEPEQAVGERERVLVRVIPGNKRVSSRLRAELDIIGLDAQELELAKGSPLLGPDLLDRLDDEDAGAAIEIDIRDDRIDVWVADRDTGKTLTRRFDLAIDPEQGRPRTLALAAVELLRASRLEASAGEAEPETPTEAEQETELERPPEDLWFGRAGSLSAGPLIGWSPGTPQSLGLTAHVELAGRWAILEPLALRFSIRVPVFGNGVTGDFGSARVFVSTLSVEPQWTPRIPHTPWFRPALGLGLGLALTAIVGESDTTGVTRRTPILAGLAVDGHLDLGFAVHPRLWLHLGGRASLIQPAPRVQFIEEIAASFGLPWISSTVALELWI